MKIKAALLALVISIVVTIGTPVIGFGIWAGAAWLLFNQPSIFIISIFSIPAIVMFNSLYEVFKYDEE